MDLDLVDAIRQAFGIQVALIVGGESVAILVALADKFDSGLKGEIVGTGDLKAKLSSVALGVDGKSEERKSETKDSELEQCAHGSGRRNLMLSVSGFEIGLRTGGAGGESIYGFTKCLHQPDKCGPPVGQDGAAIKRLRVAIADLQALRDNEGMGKPASPPQGVGTPVLSLGKE